MKKKYLLVFAIAALACSVIGGSVSADVWEGIETRCRNAGGEPEIVDETGADSNGVPYYTVTCTLGDNANKSSLNDCTFSADGKVCTWTNVQKSSEKNGGGNSGGSSSARTVDRSEAAKACTKMGGGLANNSSTCQASRDGVDICASSGGAWNPGSKTCTWRIKYDDDYYAGAKVCKYTESGATVKAERCAHKIYKANGTNAGKTACKNGQYDTILSKYISVTTVDTKAAKIYAEAVCGVLLSENVDPCNYENSTAREECIKSNKKYYWDDPDATINPSSKESSTNSNSTVESGECTSILPSSWCGKDGIINIVHLIKDILTGLVVVAGTIGIVVCGVMWMTARDNEAQVATAKRRIFEIVVGIVVWILLYALANLLIPTSTNIGKVDNNTEQVKIVG